MKFQSFLELKTDRLFYLIRSRVCLKILILYSNRYKPLVKQKSYQKAVLYIFIGNIFLSSYVSKAYSGLKS